MRLNFILTVKCSSHEKELFLIFKKKNCTSDTVVNKINMLVKSL